MLSSTALSPRTTTPSAGTTEPGSTCVTPAPLKRAHTYKYRHRHRQTDRQTQAQTRLLSAVSVLGWGRANNECRLAVESERAVRRTSYAFHQAKAQFKGLRRSV
eukprot:1098011-Pleurochrysis_carterae.AAC.2